MSSTLSRKRRLKPSNSNVIEQELHDNEEILLSSHASTVSPAIDGEEEEEGEEVEEEDEDAAVDEEIGLDHVVIVDEEMDADKKAEMEKESEGKDKDLRVYLLERTMSTEF